MAFEIENGVLKEYREEKGLKEVVIPDSVTSIGEGAFSGTRWLEEYPDDFVIVGDHILIKYK